MRISIKSVLNTTTAALLGVVISGALFGTMAEAAPNGTNPKAMTWSNGLSDVQNFGTDNAGRPVVNVGCHNCNSYQGDTDETETLRILCFVPSNVPMPPAYGAYFDANWTQGSAAINNWKFYHGWSGGLIGLSSPVSGVGLKMQTVAAADAHCKGPQGLNDPNARMMEFHDNGVGGWKIGGSLHPNSKAPSWITRTIEQQLGQGDENKRFWVRINDQNSNPWD